MGVGTPWYHVARCWRRRISGEYYITMWYLILQTLSDTLNYIHGLLLKGKILANSGNTTAADKAWREILSFDRTKKSLSTPQNRLLFYEAHSLLGMAEEAQTEKRVLIDLGISERHLALNN